MWPTGASARPSSSGDQSPSGAQADASPSTPASGDPDGRAVEGTGSTRSLGPPAAAARQRACEDKKSAKSARTMGPKRWRASLTGDSLYPISTV